MAGNATDMRRQADDRYDNAKKAGVTGNDLATLKAARDAARDRELAQTGGHRQAGEK